MPYSDPARQREYQRVWRQGRWASWASENGPCAQCGSTDRLEVDHIDPSTKVSHRLWSFSLRRRKAELAKCQVLCYKCHKKKTAAEQTKPLVHGTLNAYKKKRCRCQECRDCNAARVREQRANQARLAA